MNRKPFWAAGVVAVCLGCQGILGIEEGTLRSDAAGGTSLDVGRTGGSGGAAGAGAAGGTAGDGAAGGRGGSSGVGGSGAIGGADGGGATAGADAGDATVGSGGAGATGGTGGMPICTPGEPACVANVATRCNNEGTAYEANGTRCSTSQTCVAGACANHECTPDKPLCSGGAVRRCASDGLSSEPIETCTASQYCDAASTSCKDGVCAPNQPGCDGDRATTCNADGSGYEPGGSQCGATTTCEAGTCRPHVCAPAARFCQGQDVKLCADNGLASSVQQTCAGQTCVESGATAACTGVCAPGQQRCDANRVQSCNAAGAFANTQDCTASSKTCVATGTLAACSGECAPGQQRCSNNRIQSCNAAGTFVNGQDCTTSSQTCIVTGMNAACSGACAPGQSTCDGNSLRTCNGGQWDATQCAATTPHCSAGACGQPPSCQGLAANCGPSNQSCCASPLVSGGTFNRINNTSYPAGVSSFRLDKYEVTVGRWRKFKAAWDGGWRPAAGSGKHTHLNGGQGLSNSHVDSAYEPGWDAAWASGVDTTDAARNAGGIYATWTTSAGASETRPINYVNWHESYAFCIWDGGFLPSEAEWNYAAAGGSEQRRYPWGTTAPGSNANLAVYGCYHNATGTCTGVTNVALVGAVAAGDGRFGQSDLAGNLWERHLDRFFAASVAFAAPCTDCAYLPNAAGNRVARGGSFDWTADYTVNTFREIAFTHSARLERMGFRCARRP